MSTQRSVGRRLLVGIGVALAVVVALAAVLLAVVNSGVATKRAVDLVLPSVSGALGREVTLTDAKLKLLPGARVRLAGITVAGRAGEPPLVQAESLDVQVGLWPLVRSLGKEVDVRAFTLVRPSVNLVKAKDGTWNFEGLGSAGEKEAPATGREQRGRTEPPAGAAGEEGARVAVGLVQVEQAAIRVVDRTLGKDDPGIALTQLDLEARGVGPGLPLEARLDAALADQKQNLHAQLSVAKLPAAVPQRAEEWPEVRGSLKLAALALDRIHALLPGDLGAIVRGGVASLDARLSTAQGTYRVEGEGDLKDVRLRGQPASGRFRTAATWSPAKPQVARIDLTDVAVRGPGVDLGGHASIETAPTRAWFVVTGPLLDLDAVMGILPESAPPKAQPAPGGAAAQGDLVPAATRKEIQAASVRGTVAIEQLKGGRLEATDVKAKATLSRGTLTLDDLSAAVFGGRVSAAGSRVSLAESVPAWKLAANLSGVDLERTLSAFAGSAPLVGKLDGRLEVEGRGTEWEKIRDALAGLVALSVKDGALTTTDLGDHVLGAIAQGLEAAGRGGAAKRVGGAAGGRTAFRDLAGKFTVKDGFLTAQSPLSFATRAGQITLGGRVGLGGQLALEGKAIVPRQILADAVSGIPLPERLEVPLGLGGTLASPSVSVRADQAIASLARGQAKRAAEDVRGKAEREGRKAAEGLLERFKRR